MPAVRTEAASMARTALALFFKISGKLQTTEADQAALLGVAGRTVRRYRNGEALPDAHDTLERISHFTTIWLDLNALFRTEEGVMRWLRSPNQKFGGQSPFERMLAGNVSDLVDVRYDVEAALVA